MYAANLIDFCDGEKEILFPPFFAFIAAREIESFRVEECWGIRREGIRGGNRARLKE